MKHISRLFEKKLHKLKWEHSIFKLLKSRRYPAITITARRINSIEFRIETDAIEKV